MEPAVVIDNQPISATFFNVGNWLTDFVTPHEPDILTLWEEITKEVVSREDKAIAAWGWVANQVKYKPFIKASMRVEGHTSTQDDFWQKPSMCARTRVGNCANKAFLLASLLRNEFSPDEVHCVLGNLHNGHPEGHAWVELAMGGQDYVMESTRADVPLLETYKAPRYEPVHYLNDSKVLAVPGRTVMTPFGACYSDWLRDYIQWTYINGGQ